METSKKRKLANEGRVFAEKWQENYFMMENNGKPLCLVCKQVIGVIKEYNGKRHYETQHKMQSEEYYGKTRIDIADRLKREYQKQKKALNSFIKPQTTSTVASYEIALLLLKKSKSFRDGELVKQCAIKMAHVSGEDKVARKFETVSLSHQTIARRVSDLGKRVSSKLKSIVGNCIYFSLALDESTYICDTSELLIHVFIRTVDENFIVKEELIIVCSLNEGTMGSNIYASHLVSYS